MTHDRYRRLLASLLLGGSVSVRADGDFGQKVLGTIGLDAGSQPDAGVYVGDRIINTTAHRLLDRNGKTVPIKGLDMNAFANVFGVSGTWKFDEGPYVTAALAVPVATLHLSADQPSIGIDREGLGDIFIEPLKLGWRLPRVDITTSYSIYAPTGQLNRKGLAQPQWMQQISAGGTVFFDDERAWRFSALTSYNVYSRKVNMNVTRGDTVQIQGGLGGRFFKLFDVGVAGYGMWQVAADSGADLPAAMRGPSAYAVGVGPEVSLLLPLIRSKLTARYEWELAGQSRMQGEVLVINLAVLGWTPD